MNTLWIVVANASLAKIYQIEDKQRILNGKDKLQLLKELDHPKSRKKDIELTSDLSGSYHALMAGNGSFTEETDPKQHEAEVFAKILISELEQGRVKNHYHKLIVIASPHFYGLLNKHMNSNLHNLIQAHVTKDYTKIQDRQLVAHLQEYL